MVRLKMKIRPAAIEDGDKVEDWKVNTESEVVQLREKRRRPIIEYDNDQSKGRENISISVDSRHDTIEGV